MQLKVWFFKLFVYKCELFPCDFLRLLKANAWSFAVIWINKLFINEKLININWLNRLTISEDLHWLFFLKKERKISTFGANIVRDMFTGQKVAKIDKQLTDFYIKNRLIIDYSHFFKSARACWWTTRLVYFYLNMKQLQFKISNKIVLLFDFSFKERKKRN